MRTWELIDQAREWLSKMTYRPGTDMEILAHNYETNVLVLRVRRSVEDSYHPGKFIHQIHQSMFQTMMLEEGIKYFQRFVFGVLETMELHEAAEWFRVDGIVVNDPHKAQEAFNAR